MSNCDTCEYKEIKGRTTHYYGCKYGWQECEKCDCCKGLGYFISLGDETDNCLVCHGIGKVEVKG